MLFELPVPLQEGILMNGCQKDKYQIFWVLAVNQIEYVIVPLGVRLIEVTVLDRRPF